MVIFVAHTYYTHARMHMQGCKCDELKRHNVTHSVTSHILSKNTHMQLTITAQLIITTVVLKTQGILLRWLVWHTAERG